MNDADKLVGRENAHFVWTVATMAAAIIVSGSAMVLRMIAPDSPILPGIIAAGVVATAAHFIVGVGYAVRTREAQWLVPLVAGVFAATMSLTFAVFGELPTSGNF